MRINPNPAQIFQIQQKEYVVLGLVLLSLAVYAASTQAGIETLGLSGDAATHASGSLSVLWTALFLVSVFALSFMELVYARMPIAASVESRVASVRQHAVVARRHLGGRCRVLANGMVGARG